MKYLALVGAVAAVTLAAGCGGVEQSAGDGRVLRVSRVASLGSAGGAGAGDPDTLGAPEGYRAVLSPATWALERVAPDGRTIWIRVAKSGCNDFHHAEVTETEDGVRLVVFDRVLIPLRSDRGCLLYLLAPRHRVELPQPLGTDEIIGQCVPGDRTAEQRICATMHEAASHR